MGRDYLYTIGPVEMGFERNGDTVSVTKVLSAQGDTLDELLDNATYFLTDQAGAWESERADDAPAIEHIESWYRLMCEPELEPLEEPDAMTLAKNYNEKLGD